jgi:hypothetical protein
VASTRARQPGRHHSSEFLREVVLSVLPSGNSEQYMLFARELYATFRHPPAVDFDRRTKRVVAKWFARGLSGHVMWLIGKRLLGRLYPGTSSRQGLY